MPQCMKQQHCAYNRITERFKLQGCIENGIKLEKQTFDKKIPFRINHDHRQTLNKTPFLPYHTITSNKVCFFTVCRELPIYKLTERKKLRKIKCIKIF